MSGSCRSLMHSVAVASIALLYAHAGAKAEDKLFIYNFSDYFAEDTVSTFAKRTGVDARVDFFDSLEVLETRLLAGGSGFDVAFPSATVGERLIQSGALKPIDASGLKNYKNRERPAKAFSLGREADIIGRVSSRLP